ncbi:hypothetical protein HDU67_004060 [Dinochytrium kinnereticum]|nr:hypothetical protein HDU67_004060 [Dinochytrium kinnereticum]
MFSLRAAIQRPSSVRAARAVLMPAVATVQQRNVSQRKAPPPKRWTKTAIEIQIIDMLYDYANVPSSKITLDSNLENGLLLDRLERYGFQWDLQETFDFQLGYTRDMSRDLQSGREASDWVAAKLEEMNRLDA